jgi:hypothetical protein
VRKCGKVCQLIYLISVSFLSFFSNVHAANEPVITVNNQVATSDSVEVISVANVSMTTSFPEGQIFYNTNGAAPTFNDKRYTSPFTLSTNTALRAIAYSSSLTDSAERAPLFIHVLQKFKLTVSSPYADVQVAPNANSFLEGTRVSVTLTKINRDDAVFAGWGGTATGTNSSLNLVMDRNHNIFPSFEARISVTNIGNGHVEFDRESIRPAVDASNPENPTFIVAAVPDPGFRFVRWETAASQPGYINFAIQTTATASPALADVPDTWPGAGKLQPVTALFAPLGTNEYSLTVHTAGDGFVQVSPPRNVFTNGESVQLTAVNHRIWMAFAGWRGDITSQSTKVTLTMDGNKTAIANFEGDQSFSSEDNVSPRDEEGNVYHNFIGHLTVKGPTRNWTFLTYEPIATEGNHIPVSISSNIVYMPTFIESSGGGVFETALVGLTRNGDRLWTRSNVYSRVVLDSRDRPYVSADSPYHRSNEFLALDRTTGGTLWKGPGTTVIIGREDRIYSFLSNNVYVFEASGALLKDFVIPVQIGGSPVLDSSGDLFVQFAGGVARISASGQAVWSSDLPLSNLALAGDRIIGQTTGRLHALDASTGALLWTTGPFATFDWSLDNSGKIGLGILSTAVYGAYSYFLSIQTTSGLSSSSPWPWPGGDGLNRGKTQWFAPARLSLDFQGSNFELRVEETPKNTSIYESTDLRDWQLITNLAPNTTFSLPAGATQEFFKAVSP